MRTPLKDYILSGLLSFTLDASEVLIEKLLSVMLRESEIPS